jgi:hypothetical protein
MFPRFLTLLCLLSLFQQASLAQQSGAATTDKVPDTCPLTKPSTTPFVPSAPYESKAAPGLFWYGTDELWTRLPTTGTCKGLPLNWVFTPPSYSWGILWWRRGYDRHNEPRPNLKITGRRLDSSSPPLVASRAEPVSVFDNDWRVPALPISVAIDFPTLGCWEVTGHYRTHELTFVVWVTK